MAKNVVECHREIRKVFFSLKLLLVFGKGFWWHSGTARVSHHCY